MKLYVVSGNQFIMIHEPHAELLAGRPRDCAEDALRGPAAELKFESLSAHSRNRIY